MGAPRKTKLSLTDAQHAGRRPLFTRDFWRRLLAFSFVWAIAAVFVTAARVASLKRHDFAETVHVYLRERREAGREMLLREERRSMLKPIQDDEANFFAAREEAGRNFAIRRMDAVELSRLVMLGLDRRPSVGNLTQFTQLLSQFFETGSSRNGVHIAVNSSSQGVADVLLRNGSTEVPPYAVGNEQAADSVDETGSLTILGRAGYIYKRRPSERLSAYDVVSPASLDPFRYPNLAKVPSSCATTGRKAPQPWLLEFRNVWMGPSGEIYLPEHPVRRNGTIEWVVRDYQYQGGCCESDWKLANGIHTTFGLPRGQPRLAKVGFSLSQHHGTTYYHITNEVLPRLLTFWHVALAVMAVPGGKIVGPGEPIVTRELLRSFGVPDSKMMLFGKKRKAPIFFERLFVPGPFELDAYRHECVVRTVGRVMAAQSLSGRPDKARNVTAPLVVLLERAQGRSPDGKRCFGRRCMANFPALLRALQTEFGDHIRLEVLSGTDPDVLHRAIRLFARATVVVGVHGAAFANIFVMRGRGTYCVHLGWENVWQLYARVARKFGVDFVNIVTKGASQDGEGVVVDVPIVVLAVRNILEKENVTLGPPRMRTNAARLALVSRRLGDGVHHSETAKRKNANATTHTDGNAFAQDGQEYLPHLRTVFVSKEPKTLNWNYPSSCSASPLSSSISRIDSLLSSNVHNLTLLTAFSRLLDDYIAWHARVSSNLEPCVKVLVWTCDQSAGLGDRMRGLLHALMLAMETRRYLVVRTPPGFPIKSFLTPHRIAWDTVLREDGGWTGLNSASMSFWGKLMEDRSVNFVRGSGGFEGEYGHVAHVAVVSRAFPHYERLVGTKWFSRHCVQVAEGVRREPRCDLNGRENTAMNRLLHRALFRFTPQSTVRARAIAAEYGLRDYIAVHARIGGDLDPIAGRFSAFNKDLNATAARLLACVRTGRERFSMPKLPIFLASDDEAFKGIFARRAAEEGFRVVVSPIFPRHTKILGRGRLNEKRVASTLADTVTETMLLSGGRVIVTTGSGMSTYAAVVGEGGLLRPSECRNE